MNGSILTEAHTQWANRPNDQRFETLEALAASVNSRRLRSRSVDVIPSRTRIAVDDGRLIINGTISPCEPTHWSFGQLCQNASIDGESGSGYLRRLKPQLAADCLNYGLEKSTRDAVKFMTIADEDAGPTNTLQAVTSSTYGRIWDADVVAATQRVVERSGGKFHNPKAYVNNGRGFAGITGQQAPSGLYASDRDVFMFLIDGGSLLDAGPRAQLNRGFFVSNSEVGARTFNLTTFLFNGVCGNHIVWGAQDVNTLKIKHTSGAPARFDAEATPALVDYANASAAPLESAVRKAQEMIIGANSEEVTDWLGKNGKFSRSEIKSAIDFAKAEEGDCRTLWHAVQGMTAYARGFDYVDARVDLESRAGKLLNYATDASLLMSRPAKITASWSDASN